LFKSKSSHKVKKFILVRKGGRAEAEAEAGAGAGDTKLTHQRGHVFAFLRFLLKNSSLCVALAFDQSLMLVVN
jgi:hypothetical protein